jgi:hypothetical protein
MHFVPHRFFPLHVLRFAAASGAPATPSPAKSPSADRRLVRARTALVKSSNRS